MVTRSCATLPRRESARQHEGTFTFRCVPFLCGLLYNLSECVELWLCALREDISCGVAS